MVYFRLIASHLLLLFIRATAALCILLLQWLLTGSKAFSF